MNITVKEDEEVASLFSCLLTLAACGEAQDLRCNFHCYQDRKMRKLFKVVCVWGGGAYCSYFKAVVDFFGREMHNVMVVVLVLFFFPLFRCVIASL